MPSRPDPLVVDWTHTTQHPGFRCLSEDDAKKYLKWRSAEDAWAEKIEAAPFWKVDE